MKKGATMFFVLDQSLLHKLIKGDRKGLYMIPVKRRPSIMHPEEEPAIDEMVRLSDENPEKKFVLFEAKYACEKGVTHLPHELFPEGPETVATAALLASNFEKDNKGKKEKGKSSIKNKQS